MSGSLHDNGLNDCGMAGRGSKAQLQVGLICSPDGFYSILNGCYCYCWFMSLISAWTLNPKKSRQFHFAVGIKPMNTWFTEQSGKVDRKPRKFETISTRRTRPHSTVNKEHNPNQRHYSKDTHNTHKISPKFFNASGRGQQKRKCNVFDHIFWGALHEQKTVYIIVFEALVVGHQESIRCIHCITRTTDKRNCGRETAFHLWQ